MPKKTAKPAKPGPKPRGKAAAAVTPVRLSTEERAAIDAVRREGESLSEFLQAAAAQEVVWRKS